ncbi:S-layer homology domain-containing protein [Sporosarcina sp. Te-1]|uniref:S-layer homology domain-containing protein n=1 Tax=Sporosarcina sp. Te-1 TaxID=2818390 RepID=UPI001A9D7721|nr:S-layer homology domain-containing protein [Sporosarcina sp. Te-1]QTD39437.1 S-layer homology domain-containing protein [Sporosarcina sp. Te-1]
MNRLLLVLSTMLLACSLPVTSTLAASPKQFIDVPPSKHFAEAVNMLAEREIIGGYPDGTFRPGNSITRGQAAAIIVKMIDLDTKNVKNPKFKDVTTANGYYKAIAALAEKQIISGYGDGRFGPNDPITRGQMASILVKAFDLPRYDFGSTTNPFVDVKRGVGHDPSIMSIYRLGITTGTSPDRFSPNTSITRGQAAKMLLATEEAKSSIVTVRASDYGWSEFKMFDSNHSESALYNAVQGSDHPSGGITDKIQLVPLKEGEGTFRVALVYSGNPDKKYYRKYYVHIKEVDGKLKLTLEETQDFLNTPAILDVKGKKQVEGVSLSTMDGKLLSDSVEFRKCGSYSPSDCREADETDYEGKYNTVRVGIEKPGRYIATVRFEGGEEIRYGLEAVSLTPSFYYSIRTLEEKPAASVDLGTTHDIGRHVLPKDSERIATITRDKGTNVFHAVGKKNGTFSIQLPYHKKPDLIELVVHVEVMGPIINTTIYESIDLHM